MVHVYDSVSDWLSASDALTEHVRTESLYAGLGDVEIELITGATPLIETEEEALAAAPKVSVTEATQDTDCPG